VLISYRPVASDTTNPLGEAFLPKVYDGEFREISDLRVERVVHALGGEPSRAEFSAVLDSYHRWKDGQGNVYEGTRGFEQAVPPGELSVGMDDVVIVGIPLGGGRVLVIFRGRITDVDVSFSASGESASLTALDARHVLDNEPLGGAKYADPSGGVIDTDAPLVFNPDNLGNCDKAGSLVEGQPLFGDPDDPDADADDPYVNHWRLGAFWRYVVGNFTPAADARLPAGGNTTPELPDGHDAVLPPTDVDGMRPSEALGLVLGSYGLDWWADPFVVVNRWSVWNPAPLPCFRIVSPDASTARSVLLQPRGEDFSKSETNLNAASMSFTTRGSVNHWRIEGDFKEYEACFELKKLWTADEEGAVSDNLDKGNRTHEDYDKSLDHVYRQWGLNEDNHWPDCGAFDFEALLGEGTWTRTRRRFFAPYAETDDEPRKCIVEVKSEELSEGWHRVGSGTICLLTDRAAIYFDMTDVEGINVGVRAETGGMLGLKDITDVRITAVVKSDERVVYEAERQDSAGSTQTVTKTVRKDTFRWVNRHSSSGYAGEGAGVVLNDSAEGGPMEATAAQLRQKTEAKTQRVSMTLPWVDLTYRVGDRVSEIDGRNIAFPSKPGDDPSYPKIGRLAYDFHGQRTEIQLRRGRS